MFIVLKYKAIKCRECEQLLSIQRKNTSKIQNSLTGCKLSGQNHLI